MRYTNREGVSLIWTVLMLPVAIGFVGLAIEATLYMPHAHLTLRGNNMTVGNRIIVRTIEVTGNGEITINRQGMGYENQTGSVFLVS